MSYVFPNAWRRTHQRLTALEAWLDPGTIRHLKELGVQPGWRCLEVGAGGGSIARWLSRQVGPDGHVTATDIDTRFLEVLDVPNLEVRRHDITIDTLPEEAFDLVHIRLVLAHLTEPEQERVFRRIVAALRPGGWLLAEEMDFVSFVLDSTVDPAAAVLLERAIAAHHRVMATHTFDVSYGRQLMSDLEFQGLVDVGAEGRLTSWRGDSPGAAAWRFTLEQIGEEIIAGGDLTVTELEEVLRLLDDGQMAFLSQVTMAAWGQRPGA